jgi:hypothetical protein
MRAVALVFTSALALAALTAPALAERHRPGHGHPKPSAPVSLTALAQPSDAGWQVVVDAIPHRAVDVLEVEVDGRITRFGATAAQARRQLVVPVAVAPGAGRDVVVTVRAGGRSRSQLVRLGAPAPVAKPTPVTVRRVNGVGVAEVRR